MKKNSRLYSFFGLIFISSIYSLSISRIHSAFLSNTAAKQVEIKTNYGVFKIMQNDAALSVNGDILYNEKYKDKQTVIATDTATAAAWHKWYLIYKGTQDGMKYYQIRNVFSGKFLECGIDSSSNLSLQQHSERGRDEERKSQLWYFKSGAQQGSFVIINKKLGKSLCLTTNGQQISFKKNSGAPNQLWRLNKKTLEVYRDDAVVNFFQRNQKWQGSVAFDQGNSIPLTWSKNKGKVLWITQDAWDGRMLQTNGLFKCKDFFNYGNSMFLQPNPTNWNNIEATNIVREGSAQNKPRQIIDIQPNNTFAWPGPGVEIGNKVYVHVGEGRGLGALNQSLWELTQSNDSLWQAKRTLPPAMSGQVEVLYSVGMVKAADGYVYSFGAHGTGHGRSANLHVARFKVSNPQQWKFWNGRNWIDTVYASENARIGTSLATSSISYVNGRYVLMAMDQGFLCDDRRSIYIATAKLPTGPFTPLKKVYDIKEYFRGKYARYYTPTIHPGAANGRNELLLTYCLNFSGCGVPDCDGDFQDPYYYRIKGIRVPYSSIGL